ncbi:MAG: 50S ribosomal protein L10 [Candidatus Vogelbacteria bacterium CG10_big_fil_rev_8_21_14_0_10_51_16]|uniref:Large ribosomal subunit protein uL10 n=1 Tax=Candidatus Vogelbacteria bacterium CG10_big_fil_rev_8_21_14_0_10_51_16 TaxID=1975045 RepID=A0A2H0RGU4_9BACT|nr:MAG: 50S ribosomal protein L10 [Candidatus Vogelbacteria bacterium CG10_big_fil_rev_8_21_14_0_10_51_16]
MAITKQKKAETIEAVKEAVASAESVVFVNFHGLTAPDTVALRRVLRSKEVGYRVAKKTLIKRALADTGITGDLPTLDGEVAIAYGSDAVGPVKEVTEFAKQLAKKKKLAAGVALPVSVIGGILEGAYLSPLQMADLAKIPSREVLLAKLLNVMQAPIQGLVGTLNEVPGSFVRVLDAIGKNKTN